MVCDRSKRRVLITHRFWRRAHLFKYMIINSIVFKFDQVSNSDEDSALTIDH